MNCPMITLHEGSIWVYKEWLGQNVTVITEWALNSLLDVSRIWTLTESHEVDRYSRPNLELGLFMKLKCMRALIHTQCTYALTSSHVLKMQKYIYIYIYIVTSFWLSIRVWLKYQKPFTNHFVHFIFKVLGFSYRF
jgi:hypothetical protein